MKNKISALTGSGEIALAFDGKPIRVLDHDGEMWFIAKDVFYALGLQWKGSVSIGPLEDDEKGLHNTLTTGGSQQLVTINESGLYALIFQSRKPKAREFRKWVTHDVLPTLRRTGRYEAPTASVAEAAPLALPGPIAEKAMIRPADFCRARQSTVHPATVGRMARAHSILYGSRRTAHAKSDQAMYPIATLEAVVCIATERGLTR